MIEREEEGDEEKEGVEEEKKKIWELCLKGLERVGQRGAQEMERNATFQREKEKDKEIERERNWMVIRESKKEIKKWSSGHRGRSHFIRRSLQGQP